MPCTQVGLPLYTPGWCADEAETWVGYRRPAVRKGPGLNRLQRLRSVSMRVSLLPLRANSGLTQTTTDAKSHISFGLPQRSLCGSASLR
jgi:hypothetical protein